MSTIAEYEYVHGAVLGRLLRAPVKCDTHIIMVDKIVMIEVSSDKMPWGTYKIEPNIGKPKILFIAYRLKTTSISTWHFVIDTGRLAKICQEHEKGKAEGIEVWIALVCKTDDIIKRDGWVCLLSPDDIDKLGIFSSCSSHSPTSISIHVSLPDNKSFRIWSSMVKAWAKGSKEDPLIIPRNRLERWLCPQGETSG